MKHWIKISIKTASIVLLFVTGLWYYHFSPVTLSCVFPVHEQIVQQKFGTGTLEAKTRVSISPRTTGLLSEVCADQGDRVKRGQIVAKMDSENIVRKIEIAEAEMEVAKATVKRIEPEIAAASATNEYFERNFQRDNQLVGSEAVSVADYEKSVEARLVSKANLEKVIREKSVAELLIKKYAADILYYKNLLKDASLLSPFDGIVMRRNREAGSVVNPGVSVMDVIAIENIWVSVWMDETGIGLLHSDQKADIEFRSSPGIKYPGKIARTSYETDRETREYLVDIKLDKLPEHWAIGQRADAWVPVQIKENVLTIPLKALCGPHKDYVWISIDNKAVMRKVKTGIHSRQKVEIISGIDEHDTILLIEKETKLREGRLVKVTLP